MKGSSDNSFIPKRGAAKNKPTTGSRKFYIFTYISYILMFAALLSAGGVYLYAEHTSNQLDIAVAGLNSEIGSFSQADMERVTQFNLRLLQAQDRLENSVSITSVFEALQAATIDTVQINSLAMAREEDDRFLMEAVIQTDSFDSTIFQRGVFLRNGTIQEVDISNVQSIVTAQAGVATQDPSVRPAISFQASLSIPLEDVPANPQSYQSNQASPVDSDEESSEQTAGQDGTAEEVNEDLI